MYQLKQTPIFKKWLTALRDKRAKARILAKLESCRLGNPGDTKTVGNQVSELRIHTGAGYRVYYTKRKGVLIILLCGGTKSSQARDIERAKKLITEIEQ